MYLLIILSSSTILFGCSFSNLILSYIFKIKCWFLRFLTNNSEKPLLPLKSTSIDTTNANTITSTNTYINTQTLPKNKSYSCLNPMTIDPHYSYTFYYTLKKMPPKSKSMNYINESINNRSKNKIICCNPDCKKNINLETYCAFDGYYCSSYCRKGALTYISSFWPFS